MIFWARKKIYHFLETCNKAFPKGFCKPLYVQINQTVQVVEVEKGPLDEHDKYDGIS